MNVSVGDTYLAPQREKLQGVQVEKDEDLSAAASEDVSAQNQGNAHQVAKPPLAASLAQKKPQ